MIFLQVLRLISATIEKDDTTTALHPENIFKNRSTEIIPGRYILRQWLKNKPRIRRPNIAIFCNVIQF